MLHSGTILAGEVVLLVVLESLQCVVVVEFYIQKQIRKDLDIILHL